jgi:tRNA1Val (adenine37-N6)-methyltransferase
MSVFRFKQFDVEQSGCAMKVNTDGVLLGALANIKCGNNILDIGTGTGVIALMLAQRLVDAQITAVEFDEAAALTAMANFAGSPFAGRLKVHAQSFQAYLSEQDQLKFDLIVSNPPFYIQSLPSPGAQKAMAKHADDAFFEQLIAHSSGHLTANGILWLILPIATSALVKQLAEEYGLKLQQVISIGSYPNSNAHREVLAFGYQQTEINEQRLNIYTAPKIYSDAYRLLLKNFLTIF